MRKISLFKSYVSLRSVWNVCFLLIKSNYGGYIGEGPEVKAFEKEFSEKFGFEHVAAVNSGSTALELAYELANIGEGDEVIIPVLTHPASGLPALHRKATVVFADIDPDLNVSIEDIKRKITSKTKAIVFVHFGGNNRGLKEVLQIAKENDFIVIEDAAQAVGSDFWGKADFTCVSLQAIKTLTSGDGGFLICKDKVLHEKAKRLRWFGYDRELKQKLGDTDLVEAGYKYHMSDITATIGRGNLRSIDNLIAHRKNLCAEYAKHGIPASIWFAYVLSPNRNGLMKFMKEHGVHTGDYHYRNDKYTIFGGRQTLPMMGKLEHQYLLLPLHHGVSVQDVKTICSLLQQFSERQDMRTIYSKVRIWILNLLYELPPTKAWAYKRLPRHRSGYKHYWVEDKQYVNTMKEKQAALPFLDTNPSTEELRTQIDFFGGDKILELGMGWGRQLERLVPFYDVQGCDIAQEYVDDCNAKKLRTFKLDLVECPPEWIRANRNRWDVSYTILVYCFFIDRSKEMKKAMQTAEAITKTKVLVWEWKHICDYMKRIYPSDKFEYRHVSIVKGHR